MFNFNEVQNLKNKLNLELPPHPFSLFVLWAISLKLKGLVEVYVECNPFVDAIRTMWQKHTNLNQLKFTKCATTTMKASKFLCCKSDRCLIKATDFQMTCHSCSFSSGSLHILNSCNEDHTTILRSKVDQTILSLWSKVYWSILSLSWNIFHSLSVSLRLRRDSTSRKEL